MKNNLIICTVLLVAGMLAFSCRKDDGPAAREGEVLVGITPLLISGGDLSVGTRAAITNGIGQGRTDSMGMFLTEYPGFTAEYYASTLNIPSTAYQNSYSPPRYQWEYFIGSPTRIKMSAMPVYNTLGKAMLASYYPYNAAVTDIKRVPFDVTARYDTGVGRLSLFNDYLWSEPVEIDPDAVAGVASVAVNYRHVAALININRILSEPNTGGHVQTFKRIVVETADGGAWLLKDGFFDATTGEEEEGTKVSSMTFYYGNDVMMQSGALQLILMPLEVQPAATDRKLKFTFYLGSPDESVETGGQALLSGPVTIDLSKFTAGSGPVEYGLAAGYRYTIQMTYQNYEILEEFEVMPGVPWTQEEEIIII